MNTFKLQLGAARVDPPRLVLKVESGGGAFVSEKLISPRSPLPILKFQVCKITNSVETTSLKVCSHFKV